MQLTHISQTLWVHAVHYTTLHYSTIQYVTYVVHVHSVHTQLPLHHMYYLCTVRTQCHLSSVCTYVRMYVCLQDPLHLPGTGTGSHCREDDPQCKSKWGLGVSAGTLTAHKPHEQASRLHALTLPFGLFNAQVLWMSTRTVQDAASLVCSSSIILSEYPLLPSTYVHALTSSHSHMHTHTHTRTHARTHTHTHTPHAHTRTAIWLLHG